LLWRFDETGGPIWPFDEVKRWPAGVLDRLVSLGIVKEIGWTYIVACDSCVDNHQLEVDIIDYPTGTIGMAKCPECGRLPVPLDRLRQWAPHFDGLARAVALAVGAAGGVTVEVPDRLLFLGVVQHENASVDLFLARGLGWEDGSQMLQRSRRLRVSASPAMLVPDKLPMPTTASPVQPAIGALVELATVGEHGLDMTLDPLWSQDVIPHADATTPQWLTVTQAAKRLMEVVSGLDVKKARSRVSSAASRNLIKTNGRARADRRIERDSFHTWLFKQREQDLAAAEKDGW